MELVYLWVEKYKNIKKQGFTFSPKFKCDFDGETLTIKDNVDENRNKNYIENFFGDNINVTAIVGKNGSGKSNILEFILEQNKYYGIYVFNYKSKLFIYHDRTLKRVESIIPYEQNYLYKPCPSNVLLYIKSNIDINNYKSSNQLTIPKTFFKFSEKRDYLSDLHKNKINLFNIFRINSLNESSAIEIEQHFNYLRNRYLHMIIKYYSELEKFTAKYFKLDKIEFSVKSLGEIFLASPTFKNIYTDDDFLKKIHTNYNRISNQNKIKSLYVLFSYLYEEEKKGFILDKFQEHSIEEIYLDIQKSFNSSTDALWNSLISNIESQGNLELVISNYMELSQIIRHEILEFSFSPTLSSGEEKLLYLLINIYDTIQKYKNIGMESYLILLDEPDTSLHPNWQKKLIEILINFLSILFDDEFQIILTSHSPFLLSDIPKENIIFLEDGKNSEGINHQQTFGANIHTLLSDSFFMEDGLMGEFAKNKINKIIRFLNGDNNFIDFPIEQIKQVIESIGEDLLRIKLLDMYYEKFEKDELEKEKQQLLIKQKEINELIESIEKKQEK